MSENDKWAWFSDEDPIPALLKAEPSNSKTDPVGLRLDILAPDAVRRTGRPAKQWRCTWRARRTRR
jgi:hypothetical protein